MSGSGGGELRAPIFNEWAKTPTNEAEELMEAERKLMRENLVKDARALGIIQGAVRSVKLQGLRRDFEYTRMSDNESLSGYIAKLFDLINQMRSYSEDLSNQRIVQKLLISLPKSYDSIAYVIKNTKDLGTIDAQDVVAILKGYEQRLDRHGDNSAEKAFASFNVGSKATRSNGHTSKSQKNAKPHGQ
ncbi:hypothetical protein L3X38_009432 [Prunus dulcis]|uniref:Uncharacterized protein n=1 Tax=Prunus dulcis TaxID=3755 RepID=A0AAD4ZCD1_PRUDU|nr:hypothetical protein L3X38_009432 [Prunus dulcis]